MVDKQFSFMPLFIFDLKGFKFEENKDKILHEVSDENDQIVDTSPKHEELNSIEIFNELDKISYKR